MNFFKNPLGLVLVTWMLLAPGVGAAPPSTVTVLTPPPGEKPVKISTGIYFLNLVSVDERAQTFTADIYLTLSWKDTRLAFTPAKGQENQKAVFIEDAASDKLKEIWWPALEMVNAGQPDITNRYLTIAPDGTVNYQLGMTTEFRARFDFHRFPMDKQVLPVQVQSFLFEKDVVEFVPDPHRIGVSKKASFDDLALKGVVVDSTIDTVEGWDEKFSEFEAHLHVHRNYDHYIWQVLLPLILILSISWSVFFIPSEAVGDRVAISLTCLLAGIAFQFAVTANLPSISYTTILDRLFTLSYLCMTFGVAVSITENHWHRNNHPHNHRLNRAGLWLMPLFFVLGLVYIIWPALG
ncbi:MAG: hypothetical protein SFY92_09460 [Verrucomicrobiae bacterium]|nr:hypothetical protein [Verrucomicrobiae bacterium]